MSRVEALPATFLEGAGEMVLPCSLGLLVPAVAVLLLARSDALIAIGSFLVAAGGVAWLRAARLIGDGADWLLLALLVAGAALLTVRRFGLPGGAGGGLLIGAMAGASWRPCVGEQLGTILNAAPTDGWRELIPMLVYVSGVGAVVVLIALVPLAWPRLRAAFEHRIPFVIGVVLTATVTITLAIGRYSDLLAELARISTR